MVVNWAKVKAFTLDVAELADAWRMAPRAFVVFYLWELSRITNWFMAIKPPIDNAQATFTGAVWGFLVPVLGWYMSTGRKWQ